MLYEELVKELQKEIDFFENNKLSSRWNSNTPPPLGIKLIEVTLFP